MSIATSTRFSRPANLYNGNTALANYLKYRNDEDANPPVAIDAQKIDGDFNNIINALNSIDDDMVALVAGSVTANSITNAQLRDSDGLSVIGRSANSSGDPADIVAGNDGEVLRRLGTALGFGQLANGAYGDLSITGGKLADGTITSTQIADDAVSTAKIPDGAITAAKLASGVGGGSLELISSGTASDDASVDFTGLDLTKYESFIVVGRAISHGATLSLRVGGTSFDSAGAYYSALNEVFTTTGVTTGGAGTHATHATWTATYLPMSSTTQAAAAITNFNLFFHVDKTTYGGGEGQEFMVTYQSYTYGNMSGSTYKGSIASGGGGRGADNNMGATSVARIQFRATSGNIAQGFFAIYGLKKS